MKAESKENKNSLLAICRSSEAAGGARSNCYEFFGSFCRYKKNEEKLLSPVANDNPELFQHYFNANHLGSGSLITNKVGATYQTLAYAPHGELLVNEINGTYDEPYKFTGYERDQESGLDYAHARYREPNKTIFYSTDPMWFKYPHITPYNYAGNNPIMVIDPTGMDNYELDVDGNLNNRGGQSEKDIIYSSKNFNNGVLVENNDGGVDVGANGYIAANLQTIKMENPIADSERNISDRMSALVFHNNEAKAAELSMYFYNETNVETSNSTYAAFESENTFSVVATFHLPAASPFNPKDYGMSNFSMGDDWFAPSSQIKQDHNHPAFGGLDYAAPSGFHYTEKDGFSAGLPQGDRRVALNNPNVSFRVYSNYFKRYIKYNGRKAEFE